MRRFTLIRLEDATGISGTGVICEGVQFWDGTCVLRWRTNVRSFVFYNSIADVEHIHGHEGKTIVEWIDKEDQALG